MAKRCNCHKNVKKAMDGGMEFYRAMSLYGKWGYHEHRCECPCGCKHDTCRYAYCAYCHFEHAAMRGEKIGLLGLPVQSEPEPMNPEDLRGRPHVPVPSRTR